MAVRQFLFRLELDDRGTPVAHAPGSPRPLDDYQIASRLSYFLWSSMPDDELFDLADSRYAPLVRIVVEMATTTAREARQAGRAEAIPFIENECVRRFIEYFQKPIHVH